MYTGRIGGWRREDKEPGRNIESQPDFSDLKSRMKLKVRSSDLQKSDLRRFSPPKRNNQLNTSSCVANAVNRALENKRIQKFYNEKITLGITEKGALEYAHKKHVPLSRLALYYLSREMMNPPETNKDDGSIISIAAEILQRFGIAREIKDPSKIIDRSFWPFDMSRLYTPPSWMSMRDAYLHKISSWSRISSTGQDRVDDVIFNLSAGNIVVFGTTVDDQWMNYNDSIIGKTGDTISGRHATILCGWDPEGFFWDENSWGNNWGIDGFCKVSPEVVASNDSSDFIVIQGGWEAW